MVARTWEEARFWAILRMSSGDFGGSFGRLGDAVAPGLAGAEAPLVVCDAPCALLPAEARACSGTGGGLRSGLRGAGESDSAGSSPSDTRAVGVFGGRRLGTCGRSFASAPSGLDVLGVFGRRLGICGGVPGVGFWGTARLSARAAASECAAAGGGVASSTLGRGVVGTGGLLAPCETGLPWTGLPRVGLPAATGLPCTRGLPPALPRAEPSPGSGGGRCTLGLAGDRCSAVLVAPPLPSDSDPDPDPEAVEAEPRPAGVGGVASSVGERGERSGVWGGVRAGVGDSVSASEPPSERGVGVVSTQTSISSPATTPSGTTASYCAPLGAVTSSSSPAATPSGTTTDSICETGCASPAPARPPACAPRSTSAAPGAGGDGASASSAPPPSIRGLPPPRC